MDARGDLPRPREATPRRHRAIALYADLVAEGVEDLTYAEAVRRLGAGRGACDAHLRRLVDLGLLERVARGRYRVVAVGERVSGGASGDDPPDPGIVRRGPGAGPAARSRPGR